MTDTNKKISSADEILLDKHGVIEAHAGTGKTYTIVNLVLRMLAQPSKSDEASGGGFVQLKNIILVTYTEKAAGELKKRIHDGIAERIKELKKDGRGKDALALHLENTLNNMHEALIGTIHSVCLRLLQTYPFESGVHFDTLIDTDNNWQDAIFRESMRTDWQDRATEPSLPRAIEALESCGTGITGVHRKAIKETALKIIGSDSDIKLDKSMIGDDTLDMLTLKTNECTGLLEEEVEVFHDILRGYGRLLEDLKTRQEAIPYIRMESIDDLIARIKTMIDTHTFDENLIKYPKKGAGKDIYKESDASKISESDDRIRKIITTMKEHSYVKLIKDILPELQTKLTYAIVYHAAELLAKRYREYKRKNGAVSFDDMLLLMRKAVCDSQNGMMLDKLQKQLRYGIIDEFQDTSPVQWSIFKTIFGIGENRGAQDMTGIMYIVGDPKQSIYSFQNADIGSYISAKNAIAGSGGRIYSLIYNYRSLPEMIAGYNAILTPDADGSNDWFLFDGDTLQSISYPACQHASAPERKTTPRPLPCKPVQIVKIDDAKNANKSMAQAARIAIQKLLGATISIPRGDKYEDITLDYRDFAVVVEKHKLSNDFIDEFIANGIPCVKYKMTGIFRSPIARDIKALLTAVANRRDRSNKAAALLTHFFNRRPSDIDTENDIDKPCPDPNCKDDELCVTHALEHWGMLADKQLWAQLFESIVERTGIRERLAKLTDRERKLADLRQLVDYCVEYLYGQNSNLERLTEQLEHLKQDENNGNLHVLSTKKSSVSILTMHAAKGLEYPVVFLMTRNGQRSIGQQINDRDGAISLQWTDGGAKHFTPVMSFSEKKLESKTLADEGERYLLDQNRERRRLLYVAMTRPQAILFVPQYPEDISKSGNNKNENDLSPRLGAIIADEENKYAEGFVPDGSNIKVGASANNNARSDARNVNDSMKSALKKIPDDLKLRKFITRETSYTQMSKTADAIAKAGAQGKPRMTDDSSTDDIEDGVIRYDAPTITDYDGEPKDDEYHTETVGYDTDSGIGGAGVVNTSNDDMRGPLKGGRHTGDALHKAIEEILLADDISAVVNDDARINVIVERYLKCGGILDGQDNDERDAAIKQAASYIKSALTAVYAIDKDSNDAIVIADIKKADRVPEMDFLLAIGKHRIRGYMDLVFRVKIGESEISPTVGAGLATARAEQAHPYRYYVLDWKSDRLDDYSTENIETYCHDKHYSLQAQVYSVALDKYLRGILGDRYDPKTNLGGALYVFLRGGGGACWYRPADVVNDEITINKHII